MKKTLIALAAVAVSSAAMAQVTIGGVIGFQATNDDGASTRGKMGIYDAIVNFTASEDLGNGVKATASAQVNMGGRTTTADTQTEDVKLVVAGGFGTVTVGTIEAGNGIIGRGLAGAPVMDSADGAILAAAGNVNIMAYASPSFGGLSLSVNTTSAADATGANSNIGGTGTSESIGFSYANGGLSLGADYNNAAERTRASVSYDLGMAKVGAGYETRKFGGAGDNYVVGVRVPMGAVTVGAAYSANTNARATSATADGATFELGAAYALSKRTTLSAAYKKNNTEQEADTGIGYAYRVRLAHSF